MEGKTQNKIKLTKLVHFFNSGVGLLYKLRGELETVQLVVEQKFRRPNVDDLKKNIQIVLNQLQPFSLNKAKEHLEKALKAKNAKAMIKDIETAKQIIFNAVNSSTVVFLKKNPDLILVIM
jgi:hypothetical protein